jgi:large subunit ribosomal protein L31e
MAEEKVFNIPLRGVHDAQRRRRASNAIKLIRNFLIKNTKTENVRLGKSINESVWKEGMQNPPRKVRVHVIKEEDVLYAELLGTEIKTPSKEEVKKKEEKKKEKKEKIKEERKERRKKTIQDEIQEEVKGKTEEVPKEEPKAEKPAEEKVEKA